MDTPTTQEPAPAAPAANSKLFHAPSGSCEPADSKALFGVSAPITLAEAIDALGEVDAVIAERISPDELAALGPKTSAELLRLILDRADRLVREESQRKAEAIQRAQVVADPTLKARIAELEEKVASQHAVIATMKHRQQKAQTITQDGTVIPVTLESFTALAQANQVQRAQIESLEQQVNREKSAAANFQLRLDKSNRELAQANESRTIAEVQAGKAQGTIVSLRSDIRKLTDQQAENERLSHRMSFDCDTYKQLAFQLRQALIDSLVDRAKLAGAMAQFTNPQSRKAKECPRTTNKTTATRSSSKTKMKSPSRK